MEDQLIKAELDLDKNRKKKEKKSPLSRANTQVEGTALTVRSQPFVTVNDLSMPARDRPGTEQPARIFIFNT